MPFCEASTVVSVLDGVRWRAKPRRATAGACLHNRDGLGSSAVNWILRDSQGFLWFATRDGLSRFDGQKLASE